MTYGNRKTISSASRPKKESKREPTFVADDETDLRNAALEFSDDSSKLREKRKVRFEDSLVWSEEKCSPSRIR